MTEDFWVAAGLALVIFAVLAGAGACSLGMGVGQYYSRAAVSQNR